MRYMADWLGILFILLLIAGALFGMKMLSRPRRSTEEEFERRSAESTSMLAAGISALNEAINPEAAKGKEVVTQMKEGRYQKRRREGKANGTEEDLPGEPE